MNRHSLPFLLFMSPAPAAGQVAPVADRSDVQLENPDHVERLRRVFRAAKRIRQVGVGRILYGSDAAAGDNLRPRESWAAFRRLPLTEREFERIARNVAPYLR